MGHMDSDKQTVTVFTHNGSEVFHNCTNVNTNAGDGTLLFDDSNGKRHEFYGVTYHVVYE